MDLTKTVIPRWPHRYWKAYKGGSIVVPVDRLNYSQAKDWVNRGGDLLCINHAAATAIVKFYQAAYCEKAHKKGGFNHYHLGGLSFNHVWVYSEKGANKWINY